MSSAPPPPSAPSALTLSAIKGLRGLLEGGEPSVDRLNNMLRFLAKWRSQILENTLVGKSGELVLSGPFAGMKYPVRAAEGSRTSRLMGGYEASLTPIIETIIGRDYGLVIDVGCAEGYYAVGLAMRMPKSRIWARDTSQAAQALCHKMAVANGLEHRIEIGGEMTPADFDICGAQRTLVLCDIEGAEDLLINPATTPGLLQADILIEVHDAFVPGLTDRLASRFAASHRITRLGRRLAEDSLPDWAEDLSDLDRLLMMWEWRTGPTPWLWMEKT